MNTIVSLIAVAVVPFGGVAAIVADPNKCKPPPEEIANDTVNQNGAGSDAGCTETSHPQLANCRAIDGDEVFNWCCTTESLEPYSGSGLHTCTKFGDPVPTAPSAPASAPVAVSVPTAPVPVPDDSNVDAPTPTATGACTPTSDPNCDQYGDESVLYECTFFYFLSLFVVWRYFQLPMRKYNFHLDYLLFLIDVLRFSNSVLHFFF